MDDKQMREAFEAIFNQDASQKYPDGTYRSPIIQLAWEAFNAAYAAGQRSQGRRDAYNKGYAAGMERGRKEGLDEAATLMQMHAKAVCAQFPDAIRAEIRGENL